MPTVHPTSIIDPSAWLDEGVTIGPYCVISDLRLPFERRERGCAKARSIMVGNDVWLGARVTLMPGVRIGDRAVVTAGRVVMEDIAEDSLVLVCDSASRRATRGGDLGVGRERASPLPRVLRG